jgi:glycine cleavage system transcriptional repressor
MLSLLGENRPGIVAAVTGRLFEAGCNLGEASMMRLGGNFGVIMLVESQQGAGALSDLLAPVAEQMGLTIHIDKVKGAGHSSVVPDVCVTVHGADRAGIVAQVTAAAAEAGLDIVDLTSEVAGSDQAPIYILHIEGTAAQGVDAIEAALEPLRTEGIRVDVNPIDTLIG